MNPPRGDGAGSDHLAEPSPWQVLAAWIKISIVSFGGGVATLSLIRQELVLKRRWLSEEEFLRDWSLCQLAPGINLIALCILIGRRGGGWALLASMVGLLGPSGAVTILLSAAYARFSHSPVVESARAGVIPAVAGVGLATAWGLLHPLAKKRIAEGAASWAPFALLFVLCFVGQRVWHLSPVAILIAAGGTGALIARFDRTKLAPR